MRVLIVGGSSSVGQAVAKAFAERGDTVLATYATRDFAIEGVIAKPLDLMAPATFSAFAEAARTALGAVDFLVLLAGVLPGKAIHDYSDALIDRVMTINFSAQAALVRELMPVIADGGGVLAMSSISGQQGSFDPVYAASKAAIIAFMKSLATWHGAKARFNCLAPGLIADSMMYDAMSPERREHHRAATPTGTLLTIEELAGVIVDLAQPQWRSLNGAVVSLTGGRFLAG